MDTKWLLLFTSESAAGDNALSLVGGKGANLARMAQAGLPVPEGFLITTAAYQEFVRSNGLEPFISGALEEIHHPDPDVLEEASTRIQAMFRAGTMPDALAQAVREAYHAIEAYPVAVRSSATAEDLPEMSFAGQQDTYLNVVGEEALLRAVVDCWASLWTARAIGYRMRNQIDQREVSLAVVVQRMVESQVSGVLFTANPLTGLRSETVIDATFGLGEALVSGRVEPDHYVVDIVQDKVTSKTVGAKALSIHGQAGGGTVEATLDRKNQQALTDEQILALASLGRRVAEHYGSPQDIEWAWANQQFYLLQTRAITNLFPLPESLPLQPLKVLFSFGAIQGVLDPITPVGRSAMALIISVARGLFGIHDTSETQTLLITAGERLWMNMTTLMRNSVGRKIVYNAVDLVEPTIKQVVGQIWDDPQIQPERKGIRLKAILQMAGCFIPLWWNVILNLRHPDQRRERIVGIGEELIEKMRRRIANTISIGDLHTRLSYQSDLLPTLVKEELPPLFLKFVSVIVAGMASLNILRVLARQLPDGGASSNGWPRVTLEILRGLPNNPTTEMDLALWRLVKMIRADVETEAEFRDYSPVELTERYRSGQMLESAHDLIERFLERYGGRGFGEIDLGRPRWLEDPLHIFEVIKGYMQIVDGEQAPDMVFKRGAAAAEAEIETLAARLRATRMGWLKARLAKFAASRVRALLGARESPKFFAVRLFALVRQAILETGQALAAAGELEQADDLLYLTLREQKEFASGSPGEWRDLIAQRRKANQREMLRRQIPRVLLTDGRAFYEGLRPAAGAGERLTGSPVSPGVVEGRVRVVLDPRKANLQPGEILVCPGTDPSWTPLFLTAAGLVMEVGGMMTHGAVVAREYGIPAVVGVDQATTRLKTGERIRLDGSTGFVEIIQNGTPAAQKGENDPLSLKGVP